MKKFLIFVFCFAFTASLWAASDCVSRVDKNLDKTTEEKINFCLNEDSEPAKETPTTEVIFSDTHEVQYPKAKSKSKNKKQNNENTKSNKKQKKNKKDSAPVSTEYFEEKEFPAFRNNIHPRQNPEEAHSAALEALRGQTKSAKKNTSKPKRKVLQPQNKTSAEEIKQAQNIENNPLASDPTDNNTVPADFLNDGVLGPADFGYNATDPAFQP